MKELKCVVCDTPLKGRQKKFCQSKCKAKERYQVKKLNPVYMDKKRKYMREYMRRYWKEKPEKYEEQKARMRRYQRAKSMGEEK